MDEQTYLIRKAQDLLRESSYAVALTGAGISTPSGVPDFRSAESGLWNRYDPMEVASIFAFRQNPEKFYDWMRPLTQTLLEAVPNPAHVALRTLEKLGPLQAIVTQNIDMLHTKAGSKVIYEVHGHTRQATCMRCSAEYEAEPLMQKFLESGEMPTCLHCLAVLKPNVILFGEQLPFKIFLQAEAVTRKSDLVIVAGSSLEVAPVGDLPLLAKETGSRLIFINYGPTPYDHLADVVIRDDVAAVLPKLAEPFTK